MALNTKDLLLIGQVVDEKLDEKLKNFPTRDEFNEKIRLLPTREEFLDSMDKLMGEVQDEREENTILDGRTSEQEIRIVKLEKIHPSGQHATV